MTAGKLTLAVYRLQIRLHCQKWMW